MKSVRELDSFSRMRREGILVDPWRSGGRAVFA